eukprot:25061-Prymnesium_polylepis.1
MESFTRMHFLQRNFWYPDSLAASEVEEAQHRGLCDDFELPARVDSVFHHRGKDQLGRPLLLLCDAEVEIAKGRVHSACHSKMLASLRPQRVERQVERHECRVRVKRASEGLSSSGSNLVATCRQLRQCR